MTDLPASTLASHVRTLARGQGRARNLTRAEAEDAMRLMLSGHSAPEAIGALLMLMRMRGETAEEIAGFAHVARASTPTLPHVDLDWPAYSAGRTRGLPWFLISADLVAKAGHRVLLHGWNGSDGTIREGLRRLDIPVAVDGAALGAALDSRGIAYMPTDMAMPPLFRLLNLRDVLGLRSCMNTVCRMLNPAGARASVQGVFHPSYRQLQSDAAVLLGWRDLTVIKGGGGEFERHPGKAVDVFGLRAGQPWQDRAAAVPTQTRRLAESAMGWRDFDAATTGVPLPEFEARIITGTAALALDTLGETTPDATAETLWRALRATPAA